MAEVEHALGWDSDRGRTVFHVVLMAQYSKRRWADTQGPHLVGFVPALQFSAVMDCDTPPSVRVLNGLIAAPHDDVWNRIFPPNDWGDRSGFIPVTRYGFDRVRSSGEHKQCGTWWLPIEADEDDVRAAVRTMKRFGDTQPPWERGEWLP